MIKFSIIIPVRSINDYLRESIPYLMEMTYPDFEVIIVTDKPETYDFKGDKRFRVISSGSVGPGEKRNIGVQKSTGEVCAFMDDDAFPKEGWLEVASEIFSDKNVYAVGGPAVTPLGVGFLERMSGKVFESWLAGGDTVHRYVPQEKRLVDDYASVNLFVRKSAFEKVGGFTTEFWPGEDTKLCLDLVGEFGQDFPYDPRLVVYHHRRDLFIPHLKQVSRYGKHRGQFAKIFPKTSRKLSYFIPTAFCLGLVLGPFITSLFRFLQPLHVGALLVYTIALLFESLRLTLKEKDPLAFVFVAAGIFFTHIVYGFNFLVGLIVRPELKLKKYDPETGNWVGG